MNNLLYFKIRREDSSHSNITSWNKLAEELAASKDAIKSLYWQSRFDHTLALYEYRMYIIRTKMGKKAGVRLKNALGYINESLRTVAAKRYDYDSLRSKIETLLQEAE
jgi:hypothetical protein